jgi:hypothetical protein
MIAFEVPIDRSEFPPHYDYDMDDFLRYEDPSNNWWYDLPSFFVIGGNVEDDSSVRISGGTFKPGRESTVGVSMPATTEDSVVALWSVGEFSVDDINSNTFDPEWMSWTPGGYIITLREATTGEYEGAFTVPSFIDDQDTVTIMAGYMDGATGIPHYSVKNAGLAGGISMMMIIGIVIAIVIVVLVIILIKK